jgi:hypothetical protein
LGHLSEIGHAIIETIPIDVIHNKTVGSIPKEKTCDLLMNQIVESLPSTTELEVSLSAIPHGSYESLVTSSLTSPSYSPTIGYFLPFNNNLPLLHWFFQVGNS